MEGGKSIDRASPSTTTMTHMMSSFTRVVCMVLVPGVAQEGRNIPVLSIKVSPPTVSWPN